MHDRLKQLVVEMVDRGIRLGEAQREVEKHFVERVLVRADGNVSRAATVMGVHRNTLARRMRELKIKTHLR